MKLRAIKQANFLWHKIIGKFFSDYFAKFNRLNFTLHYRAIYLKLRAACGLFFGKFSLFTSRAYCALFLASFVIGCNSSANIGDVAPEILQIKTKFYSFGVMDAQVVPKLSPHLMIF